MTGIEGVLVAVLVAGILNFAIVLRIRAQGDAGQGAFLARVYLATLILRATLAIVLNASSGNSSFAAVFWGDSETYDRGGWLLALSWSGETVVNPHVERSVSGYGFYYLVGSLYWVFGRNALLVQFVNATIGSLTVIVIHAIARDLFDARVARWAALFMAFFPQMVFWSGALYKDPAIMLCIATSMYAVLRLTERFTLRMVLLFTLSSLALMTLRFYVFYFVAFATLGTFLFSQRERGVLGSVLAQVALLAIFLGAFSFAARRETVERHTQYFQLRQLQVVRSDQASLGKSATSEADVSTAAGAISALPVGLVYLLFAPFPWSISGIRQILTLPETLVWYALMPSFVRGLAHAIRHRLRQSLAILVFAGSLTAAYALFQGNVGTAYRQRTQITMFFFIFMGVGLTQRERERAGLALASAEVSP